jgi:hypothetical protein
MASRRGPDNSVRLAISGTIRGQNFANIFHCQLTTSSTIAQADLDTWNLAVFNAYKTRFQALLGTDVTVSFAKAVLYAPGGGELVSTQGTAYAGTGTPATSPGGVSKVLSWVSSVYWRGGKPRTYLPGLITADLTSGADTIPAGQVTTIKTAATNYRTDVNALTAGTITGTSLGFVSFRSHNAERGTPLFFAFNGVTVHPRVGMQRRRDGRWIN